MRASVWSLCEQTAVAFIKGPKLLPPKGVDFSSNGKFMCLAERKERECKDQISIYYAGGDFKLTNSFEVTGDIFDMVDCRFVLKNTAILVQDSCLESKFVIYSATSGRPLAVHEPGSSYGLGIRQIKQSPNEKMLVCGMYSNSVSLYNNINQRLICDLEHIDKLSVDTARKGPIIFEEKLSKEQSQMPGVLNYRYDNLTSQQTVRIPKLPQKDLQTMQVAAFDKLGSQSGPQSGIQLMEWSFDSIFLATKCE